MLKLARLALFCWKMFLKKIHFSLVHNNDVLTLQMGFWDVVGMIAEGR